MTDQLKPYTAADRADDLIRVVHPQLAAEMLATTVAKILARRTKLGLPPVDEQFAQPLRSRKSGDRLRKKRTR